MKIKDHKFSKNSGFTLVESLVSILILSMGILPSIVAIVLANNFTTRVRNNLIAANLAQEGIEVVRSVRDSNWFDSGNPPFDRFLDACDSGCTLDWTTSPPGNNLQPAGSPAPFLKIDANGVYNYSTGTNTIFKRRVIITKDPSSPGCNCEIKVVSEITWSDRGHPKIIIVEAHLFNWK